MVIVFLHARQKPGYAEIMVKSAKKFDHTLIQLTDEETPAVRGVDRVIRLPWDGRFVMSYKLKHLAFFREPCMIVDTDVIFKHHVSHVMDRDFDVALTRRKGPILDKDGIDVTIRMPYNCGVMFSKEPRFWRAALKRCLDLPAQDQTWYGDQKAVKDVASRFNVLELDCEQYNYTPSHPDEDVSKRLIVHYKGNRKDWMYGDAQRQKLYGT